MEDMSNPQKCFICEKKLKLTAIMCNCKNYYCNKHRYSENHNCKFNYKDNGRILLEINNPLIKSNKLERI